MYIVQRQKTGPQHLARGKKVPEICPRVAATRRAGAASAAGVLQLDAEIHGDVQQGLGLSVIVIGEFPRFEFHGLTSV